MTFGEQTTPQLRSGSWGGRRPSPPGSRDREAGLDSRVGREGLLGAQGRHSDIVVGLVEVGQEEDVQQLQLVDGHALLNG